MSSRVKQEDSQKMKPIDPQKAKHLFRRLSVVIPVYNEVYTIKQVLDRVLTVPLPMEIILVDDCSTDGTTAILKDLQKNLKTETPIKFLFKEKNQGKGAALRDGIKMAEGDLLIVQDADLEYDPHEYPKLIEPIISGDADVVYGSRFRGDRQRVLFYWHTLGNKFLTTISNIFTNLNLTDMETCYKVFKTEIIKSLPLRANRFGFEPEVTAKVAKLRCRIYEVPISYRGRGYAEGKKITWKDGFSAIYTMLKFWIFDDLYDETAGLRTLRIMEGAGDYNAWLFKHCKDYLGHRVLEVGAGVGNITKYLVSKELVVASDYTDYYLDDLRVMFQNYKNVHVRKLDLLDGALAKNIRNEYKPDSVMSLNVLEHIEDHKAALKNTNSLLENGGRLVILVPAHQFLFSNMDKHLDHFRRYNKKTLKALLEEAGFVVERIKYVNMIGALGWFVNGKVFRRKLIPSRQVRVFDYLVPFLSLEKIFKPPFGLSVIAVAKKVNEPS